VAPAAAGVSAARLDVLHQSLDRIVDAGKYSGYVVLLARDGRIVDWHAHGWQDIAAQTPMQPDAIVRLFSMTKLITSAAILMLMEDGRLQLTDPMAQYLPELANPQVFAGGTADAPQLVPASRPITIRDLLTHTSGYYYDAPWSADPPEVELMSRAKIWESADLAEFVHRVARVPLHQQPGTRFRYGISTDLLGAIVEKVSGQTLDVFFQQRLLGPLGLRDTAFSVPPGKRRRLALIYSRDPAGRLVPNPSREEQLAGPARRLFSGGGGLYSTAADYVRFAQLLLNGGQLGGTRLLGRKTVELMTANHIAHLADPHPFGFKWQGFGLGVRVVTDLGESPQLASVGTYGWDGAATTNVQIDPHERTVALLLCQHATFNEGDIIATFSNGYYSALDR
jgi:CubicO group peptidase (beta-lactamase class C family)